MLSAQTPSARIFPVWQTVLKWVTGLTAREASPVPGGLVILSPGPAELISLGIIVMPLTEQLNPNPLQWISSAVLGSLLLWRFWLWTSSPPKPLPLPPAEAAANVQTSNHDNWRCVWSWINSKQLVWERSVRTDSPAAPSACARAENPPPPLIGSSDLGTVDACKWHKSTRQNQGILVFSHSIVLENIVTVSANVTMNSSLQL